VLLLLNCAFQNDVVIVKVPIATKLTPSLSVIRLMQWTQFWFNVILLVTKI